MSATKIIHPLVETLIIGGGPAGLATALGLARARRNVILFDSNVYRNRTVSHMHNVTTWDHANPSAFRESARRELTQGRYKTIQIKDLLITEVIKNAEGVFQATDAAGETWQGKTLVLGAGITDVMPDIPGYRECWESSKIYHCLYCHGYEDSDCPLAGIIASFGMTSNAHMASHVANLASQFAHSVVIYTNGSDTLTQQLTEHFQSNLKITIDSRSITALVPESNVNKEPGIELESTGSAPAETVSHRFFVHAPQSSANVGFAQSLGLEMVETGAEIKSTAPFGATNVKGCFVVGDLGSPIKTVTLASSSGCMAAVGVTAELF